MNFYIPDIDYFSQEHYISNSAMSDLQGLMRGEAPKDLSQYYDFGTLVDAIITEPNKVHHDSRTAQGITFDEDKWDLAMQMKKAGEADPTLKAFTDICNKQAVYYLDSFIVEHNGFSISVPAKVKLDFEHKPSKIGGDLKSTVCETQKSFVDAIELFEYDRQAAWYMDVANLNNFMIIGLSKKKCKRTGKHFVFKHAITRGDEMYLRGKAKYSRLAFYYKFLILNLSI